jgi:hypothetical protein
VPKEVTEGRARGGSSDLVIADLMTPVTSLEREEQEEAVAAVACG